MLCSISHFKLHLWTAKEKNGTRLSWCQILLRQSDRLGVKTSRTREINTCQDRRSDVFLYVCCLPFNLWILVTPLASSIFLFPVLDTLLRASGAGLKIMSTFTFGFGFMVFNATFNNISVILWRSVLLEKETRVPRENHRHVASN